MVRMVAKAGKLPVPNFSAGGIDTPADAAVGHATGAESVFVGSGIFMQDSTPLPIRGSREAAKAIVLAATHFNDPKVLLEVSGKPDWAMKGLAVAGMTKPTCCRPGAGSGRVRRPDGGETLARQPARCRPTNVHENWAY